MFAQIEQQGDATALLVAGAVLLVIIIAAVLIQRRSDALAAESVDDTIDPASSRADTLSV